MHRKIAELINKIVKESPYNHFTCQVIPNPEGTDGFWKCVITFESRDDAHSGSLVRLLRPLGMVYGESLYIQDKKTIVEVN